MNLWYESAKMRESVPAVQVLVHIGMMYFRKWMLYFLVVDPFSFMCPVFVYRPGQAVANSDTVHRTALSSVSNFEPSALHAQEMLFFTQRFSEKLLLVKKRLLLFV